MNMYLLIRYMTGATALGYFYQVGGAAPLFNQPIGPSWPGSLTNAEVLAAFQAADGLSEPVQWATIVNTVSGGGMIRGVIWAGYGSTPTIEIRSAGTPDPLLTAGSTRQAFVAELPLTLLPEPLSESGVANSVVMSMLSSLASGAALKAG